MAAFSPREGYAAAKAEHELRNAFLAVVLGILLHFIWEVLAGSLREGKAPDFGAWWAIAARGALAFIVGMVSFLGIWRQLEGVEPRLRFFSAVTQGFAVDALASPLAPGSTANGADAA